MLARKHPRVGGSHAVGFGPEIVFRGIINEDRLFSFVLERT
jgi:hypothetical protein